jgi:hypothetical protein
MNKMVIGFSKPRKFKPFAELIKFVFATPYDHVYLKFQSDFFSRDLIYQASKLMVNFMGSKTFLSENLIIDEFEIELTDEQMQALIAFAIDNACKPYGMLEAFGLGLVRVSEIFGKTIRNPFGGGTQNYVCSVLAAYVLQNFTSVKLIKDFQDMSPKDVWDFLESKGLPK